MAIRIQRRPASTTTPTPTSWRSGCCAGRWTCSICFRACAAPSSRTRLELSAEEIVALGRHQPEDVCAVPRRRDHQPVRRLRKLAELDWEDYRTRYGNIQRLDLILEAENDSANRYKLSKQADVLMLFYLFSAEELRELFERLGYPFEYETIPKNVAYYAARSSHGSTLSRVVYAWVLARSDRPRSMNFFAEALQSDVSDIQQGTTAEGVHLGAMAGHGRSGAARLDRASK